MAGSQLVTKVHFLRVYFVQISQLTPRAGTDGLGDSNRIPRTEIVGTPIVHGYRLTHQILPSLPVVGTRDPIDRRVWISPEVKHEGWNKKGHVYALGQAG
ncbi:hypothetical protein VNO77_20640 [Canavalia gladiata]|uniref:Uncharacterized protein n=1 Tax=Canavalia gladiata TaxID=3824 RepID=A0AAN9QMM4_CANGL